MNLSDGKEIDESIPMIDGFESSCEDEGQHHACFHVLQELTLLRVVAEASRKVVYWMNRHEQDDIYSAIKDLEEALSALDKQR